MLKTSIGRLRVIGLIEGISFLVLLGIAMPLKYLANIPIGVTIAGSIHGLFFALYVFVVIQAKVDYEWSIGKVMKALIASVIPFGTFVLDKQLRKQIPM